MHQSFDHEDVSELSVALSALRLLISAGRALQMLRKRRNSR